jgi:hypothetical protein
MLGFGSLALWSVILVGLFNSIMFPSIFTPGIAGLGPLNGEGSGLLIAVSPGRLDRHPARLHSARGLLRLHCVLRVQRIEAKDDDCGRGRRA